VTVSTTGDDERRGRRGDLGHLVAVQVTPVQGELDAEDGGDRVQRKEDVRAADRHEHEKQRRDDASPPDMRDELAGVVAVADGQPPAREAHERVVLQ